MWNFGTQILVMNRKELEFLFQGILTFCWNTFNSNLLFFSLGKTLLFPRISMWNRSQGFPSMDFFGNSEFQWIPGAASRERPCPGNLGQESPFSGVLNQQELGEDKDLKFPIQRWGRTKILSFQFRAGWGQIFWISNPEKGKDKDVREVLCFQSGTG